MNDDDNLSYKYFVIIYFFIFFINYIQYALYQQCSVVPPDSHLMIWFVLS